MSYLFRILMINEFTGLTLNPCDKSSPQCFQNGDQVIDVYDVGSLSMGACFGILIGFAVFWRFLAYVSALSCQRERAVLGSHAAAPPRAQIQLLRRSNPRLRLD